MVQFTSLILDYPDNLTAYYQKFSDLPGFVLLESTDRTHGRYDIMSAYPYDRIIIAADSTDLDEQLAPLYALANGCEDEGELPFQGGAIGYISYELGAKLAGINVQYHPHLSNLPLLDLALYDWAFIVDHHENKVTLFAANRQSSTLHLMQDMLAAWHGPVRERNDFVVEDDFIALMGKNTYQQAFTNIQSYLQCGRSYQVNFTQAFQAEFSGDSWEMYQRVSQSNPVPFSAFIRNGYADIVSFSPERFLLHDQGKLLTSPIKGTIGRSPDPEQDALLKNQLAACEKNRAENVMIVDLLRNDLGRIAKPNTVNVTRLCTIESYQAVHHLVSDIEAYRLPEINPVAAFLSCFPGGSITGAPKLESMRIINELEPYSRGIYCGSIGYFSNHGRFDTSIAIRTVIAKDNTLHLAAGGGIVMDSVCEEEYQECYTKIAAIVNGIKRSPY